MTVLSGAGKPASPANVWSIDVSGTEPSRADEIRNSVLEALIGGSFAQHVVLPGSDVDRVLEIRVTRVRHVSPGERWLLGTLAGRNVVDATITLRDPHDAAAAPLKSFTIDAESAAHPLSGVSDFQDALKKFADKTMDGLRS